MKNAIAVIASIPGCICFGINTGDLIRNLSADKLDNIGVSAGLALYGAMVAVLTGFSVIKG